MTCAGFGHPQPGLLLLSQDMTAAKYDIQIEQGATFRRVLRWEQSDGTPVDLTGATAKMQAWDRDHKLSSSTSTPTAPSPSTPPTGR